MPIPKGGLFPLPHDDIVLKLLHCLYLLKPSSQTSLYVSKSDVLYPNACPCYSMLYSVCRTYLSSKLFQIEQTYFLGFAIFTKHIVWLPCYIKMILLCRKFWSWTCFQIACLIQKWSTTSPKCIRYVDIHVGTDYAIVLPTPKRKVLMIAVVIVV